MAWTISDLLFLVGLLALLVVLWTFVRLGKWVVALSIVLAVVYLTSLYGAAQQHAEYATDKIKHVATEIARCSDPEIRQREAKVAKREKRPNSCTEADLLANKDWNTLVRESIAKQGWCYFLLRFEGESGIDWLANSHMGYYAAVSWYLGAGIVAVSAAVFVWSALPDRSTQKPTHKFVGPPPYAEVHTTKQECPTPLVPSPAKLKFA